MQTELIIVSEYCHKCHIEPGKKTPWIGRFWSGVAGEMKRGQEIFGEIGRAHV